MKKDALLNPIPVRFPVALKVRVKNAAARFGLKPSDIVRQAVLKALPEWEVNGVMIIGVDKRP